MATQQDVRRIALALDGVTESDADFRFFANGRQFIWLWQERVDPKKARVPNPGVIVVRVANDIDKHVLLALDRDAFFTEPHYDGFPAVLVRLAEVSVRELRPLITEAWRTQAPREQQEPKRARRT